MKTRVLQFMLALCLIAGMGQTAARELKILFSQYSPPYVFENDTGIVVDIVRTALETAGYQVKPLYVPFGRALKMFSENQADGTTIIQEASGVKAHYSDYFMHYQNRAFALSSSKLSIRNIDDLKYKSVIAFQSAAKYLGEEFGRMAAANMKYKELAQQDAQIHMILLGRAEVAVADERIFRYYREKLITEGKADRNQSIDTFDIFPPTPYKVAFNDAKVRDDFNKVIATMKKDGRYEMIYRKYAEQYFAVKK